MEPRSSSKSTSEGVVRHIRARCLKAVNARRATYNLCSIRVKLQHSGSTRGRVGSSHTGPLPCDADLTLKLTIILSATYTATGGGAAPASRAVMAFIWFLISTNTKRSVWMRERRLSDRPWKLKTKTSIRHPSPSPSGPLWFVYQPAEPRPMESDSRSRIQRCMKPHLLFNHPHMPLFLPGAGPRRTQWSALVIILQASVVRLLTLFTYLMVCYMTAWSTALQIHFCMTLGMPLLMLL